MHAQEICGNNLEEDGDGYIYCYNSDCSGNVACDGAFSGKPVPTCQFTPVPVSDCNIGLTWLKNIAIPLNNGQVPVVAQESCLINTEAVELVTRINGIEALIVSYKRKTA
jgi:hypothetical protein